MAASIAAPCSDCRHPAGHGFGSGEQVSRRLLWRLPSAHLVRIAGILPATIITCSPAQLIILPQAIAWMTPPSTRRAAPLVADASGLHT